MMRNQKGFTLVEVLISALILGMIVLVWSSLEVFTSQVVKKTSDFSLTQKVLINIMNDVLASEKGLPPHQPPEALSEVSVTRDRLAETFNTLRSQKLTRQICYDQKANQITDPNRYKDCFYYVHIFKYRLDDRSYPATSQLSQIPLARLLLQVQYYDMDYPANFDDDRSNDRILTRYMTRLVSNVAEF